jgi:signal transduction histidine kinase
VLTFDDDGALRFHAWRNLSAAYRSAVEGHSPWPRGAVDPQPVLVPDAQQDASLASYAALFRNETIAALAFIPLVNRGRLLGKFVAYYDQPQVFTEEDIGTAKAIANHLASVMARFRAMATLEETVSCNEMFTGILAHDLRNPLNAMMTAAQLLLMRTESDDELRARAEKPLSRILSSGSRMSTMIGQVLDFTRARSGGGLPVEPQATNLAELCGQAIGELELTHPQTKIWRRVTGDPCGRWDPDRMLQVLSNLVANACQHGSQNEPVRVVLDGTSEDKVSVEVHNCGAIPGSLLPTVFDPFRSTRVGKNRSRGLGMGLFIVREIVRGHRGTVEVSSTESAGTSIVVHLPRYAQRKSDPGP